MRSSSGPPSLENQGETNGGVLHREPPGEPLTPPVCGQVATDYGWTENEAAPCLRRTKNSLRLLAGVLARGYLRLLTARSGQGLDLPTYAGDTAPKILDSPLDVSRQESNEWVGCGPSGGPGAS